LSEKKINNKKLTLCQFPVLGIWVPEQTLWIIVSKTWSGIDHFYSEKLQNFLNSCGEKPKVYHCKVNEQFKQTCGPLPPSCGTHWNSMLKDLNELTVGKFQWRVIKTGIWIVFEILHMVIHEPFQRQSQK